MFQSQELVQITVHKKYHGVMPPHKIVILGNFEIMQTAEVDGETWYTVQVIPRITPWVRTQNPNLWYEHHTSHNYKVLDTFDMHEKLYNMLILRWS